jgi:hypothetical protein
MIETFQGLAVTVLALIPGALFMWSFERIAGAWGIGFSDRFLRFLGISVLLHVVAAPVTYVIWHDYLRPGALGPDQALPLWLWPVSAMYVAVPIFLGTALAVGLQNGAGWAQALDIGSHPPTAWDAIFSNEPDGWVLIRLKSGRWIGGRYADGSYAGGYPEPADLFLVQECAVDQESEEFVIGPNGEPETLGPPNWGLLVRWEEIEYLQVTPT